MRELEDLVDRARKEENPEIMLALSILYTLLGAMSIREEGLLADFTIKYVEGTLKRAETKKSDNNPD